MTHDLIIIGAGPCALALAKSLADSPFQITIIEQADENHCANPDYDGRDIALTHHSKALLQQFNLWHELEHIYPIEQAKVFNGQSVKSLDFWQHSGSALGYLVSNHDLRATLYHSVCMQDNVQFMWQTRISQVEKVATGYRVLLANGHSLTTPLLIAADSRFSNTRRQLGIASQVTDFARTAIVARMSHDLTHQKIAYECFLYGFTLAVLPLSEHESSVVITADSDQAQQLIALDEHAYAQFVMTAFGHQLGKMALCSQRFSYPLVGVLAKQFSKEHVALIGDAAVGMHPVTAHGFNLGLKGAHKLAQCLCKAEQSGQPYWSTTVLNEYERYHQREVKIMYYGTNGLVHLFTNDSPPAKLIRNWVLNVSRHCPPIRKAITAKLAQKTRVF
ncbi:hypothetical protein PULV_a2007 [Pseudoalteromonas ulvae UL12]|uniref:5-demethoxyubiquinol-8 5-hydroxylase UbiM n=1 Tax=Pseudoalteromonas ulvae TaxID=107327 RepID=UPI00186B9298|nr:5-demethoxyubiquinol-8 5-hydroxylase UbiM [Pseudoalteromonas ulvae]MBE0365244.1 hypothetical protein [Pseudoalteromonas ulvae UL12]